VLQCIAVRCGALRHVVVRCNGTHGGYTRGQISFCLFNVPSNFSLSLSLSFSSSLPPSLTLYLFLPLSLSPPLNILVTKDKLRRITGFLLNVPSNFSLPLSLSRHPSLPPSLSLCLCFPLSLFSSQYTSN